MSEYDHHGNQAVEDRDATFRASRSPHAPGNGVGDLRTRRSGLGAAVARHPILVILPAILLLAAGVYVGAKKHPTYSASATINVGKSDIITQATPGYVQAAQVLASSYSRVVMSQHVVVPVAQSLGESVGTVAGHVSAVPIPGEPTFTITATAASQQKAVSLANAAVNAVVKFANVSQTQGGSPSQLLARYRAAQNRADSLHSKSASLAAKRASGVGGISQAQVTNAQVASQVAALQAQADGNAYTSLMENGVAPVLDVFNPATSATSNRRSNVEKYAVVGVVAGLVLGLALAALVGGLEDRREMRRFSLPA